MVSCLTVDTPTPNTCWSGSALLFDADSRNVRTYFTTAFTIVNTLLPFVGSFVIKRINQRAILKGAAVNNNGVPLSHLSPWLSLTSTALNWFRTRRFPGGPFGVVMLFSGLISVLSSFIVSYFVFDYTLAGHCPFGKGVVLSEANAVVWPEKTPLPDYFYPTPLWPGSTISVSSQMISYFSRPRVGLTPTIGISQIANNGLDFYARNEDILGGWQCNRDPSLAGKLAFTNNLTRPNQGLLYSQLVDRDLLYTNTILADQGALIQPGYSDGLNAFANLVGLSSSLGSTWDVKAVMISNLSGDSDTTQSSFTDLHCNLVASPQIPSSNTTLDLILSNTNASAVLTNWGPLILGAIMVISQGNATGYTQVLETHLNAMIMSWGSNDNADHTASVSGCVLSRAATNIGVWLILAIEIILLLILGVLDLVTLLALRRNKYIRKDQRHA